MGLEITRTKSYITLKNKDLVLGRGLKDGTFI
jgi:hypothetical protein